MSVCLDYQSVYARGQSVTVSVRTQVLLALVLLALLSLKVWIKIEIVNTGYQLGKERNLAVELDLQRRELEMERSVLLRPDHLAHEARVRLHLLPLDPARARRVRY